MSYNKDSLKKYSAWSPKDANNLLTHHKVLPIVREYQVVADCPSSVVSVEENNCFNFPEPPTALGSSPLYCSGASLVLHLSQRGGGKRQGGESGAG